MTKEQYEGTPELIFYCEYNPDDFEDRLEIPFTNEYDIKLCFSRDEDNQVCINVDLQPKESNIPKDFFGKNILNVTAIAGKNGVGKSGVLKNIYTLSDSSKCNICIFYTRALDKFDVDAAGELEVYINSNLIEDADAYKNNGAVNLYFHNLKHIYGGGYNGMEYYGFPRAILENKNYAYFYKLLTNSKFVSSDLFKKYFDVCSLQEMSIHIDLYWNKFYEIIGEHCSKYIKNILENELVLVNKSVLIIVLDLLNYLIDRHHIGSQSIDSEVKILLERIVQIKSDSLGISEQIIEYIERVWGHSMKVYFLSLQNLSEKYFKLSESRLEILFDSSEYDVNIFNVLDLLCFIENYNASIDLGSYSSGEYHLLMQISMLNDVFSYQTNRVIILFLDEYEQHLHPEWSRKYLSYLLEFLDMQGGQFNIKYQIVLVTHSPYLISDLPKENIILLEKNEETGTRTARKSNYGFASNYYDIMSDNFFLDDTIGEFAKQKINICIQTINRISDDLDKLANDELILHDGLSLFVEDSLKTIEDQNKIINLVGDKFIQKQLQQLSNSVKQRLLAHGDDSVRKQQIEQDIAELEEKLRQKKMELNND